MRPVRGGDPVGPLQVLAHADCHGLLALALMHGSRDFAREEQSIHAVLEPAYQEHAPVEKETVVHGGCWVLGVGCWVLGVGCWVFGIVLVLVLVVDLALVLG